jgi:MFS family permease
VLTLALTHSATKAGVVGFAATLPLLALTLHAGVLVDRYNRKRLMLACEGARALARTVIRLAPADSQAAERDAA